MTAPPILTGKEAELNRAERMLSGEYTAADMELYMWVMRNVPQTSYLAGSKIYSFGGVFSYQGEQIWPPT